MRALAERLGRGRVLRRKLALGSGSVPILVSPDAQLKYLKPGRRAFDRDLVAVAEAFVGLHECVWDIGANVGVFAFAAAARTDGPVVALDADPWLCALMRRTAALTAHAGKDVRVVAAAVADRDGVGAFQIAARGRASNALAAAGGRSQMGGVRETIHVPVLTLDTLGRSLPPPSFVKIDVEGAEIAVLRGGAELLARTVRGVYVELSPESFAPCLSILRGHGFACFDMAGRATAAPNGPNHLFLRETEAAADGLERFRSARRG